LGPFYVARDVSGRLASLSALSPLSLSRERERDRQTPGLAVGTAGSRALREMSLLVCNK
jgi:hypothetical protein